MPLSKTRMKELKASDRIVKPKSNLKRVVDISPMSNLNDTVGEYPNVIYWLIDKEKRAKLEAIVMSLKKHNVQHLVRFGIAGLTFDVVGELLDTVKGG